MWGTCHSGRVQTVSSTGHSLLAAAVTFTLQDLTLTVGLANFYKGFCLRVMQALYKNTA